MVAVKLSPDPLKSSIFILHEFQSLNEDSLRARQGYRSHLWRPPTDVYETETALVVRIEIAGMEDSDFTIVIDGSTLMIRGVRAEPPERRAYHQMEIRFGEFGTEVDLPYPVIVDQVEAVYSMGFLRIVLPKAPPKKISIDE